MVFRVEPQFDHLREWMESRIPFNVFLGVRCEHLVRGEAVLRLPWRDELLGDTSRGAVHGGVISMLVDTAGGAAAFTGMLGPDDRGSTVDLRVDYLRPLLRGHDLVCRGRLVRMGNRVAACHMEVYADALPAAGEAGAPVATGQAVYNVVRRTKPTEPDA